MGINDVVWKPQCGVNVAELGGCRAVAYPGHKCWEWKVRRVSSGVSLASGRGPTRDDALGSAAIALVGFATG